MVKMSLCLVSAFLNIGRQDWSYFQRSLQQYFNNFSPYTRMGHPMILFLDDRYLNLISSDNIKIIPINLEWCHQNLFAFSLLEKEREIMNSDKFKKLVAHRLHHPECCKPEYNIIQHAKIDFIGYVIENKLSEAEYLAWTDFGYFQDPSRIPSTPDFKLDVNKFRLDRINFQGINPLDSHDKSIGFTLTHAPEKIGGFFYLGTPMLLLQYQQLYHKICYDFHKMGIVDDDQHIMIQAVFRQPELFHVWNLGGWHLTYLKFR